MVEIMDKTEKAIGEVSLTQLTVDEIEPSVDEI